MHQCDGKRRWGEIANPERGFPRGEGLATIDYCCVSFARKSVIARLGVIIQGLLRGRNKPLLGDFKPRLGHFKPP